MSLPSTALFYDENDELIKAISINCGWSYEGIKSVVKVIEDILVDQNKYPEYFQIHHIPEEFSYVSIYEETLTKREFNLLVDPVKTLSSRLK